MRKSIIKQLLGEVDQYFLNKYPLGKILAVSSRYENRIVKNENNEDTVDSYLIVSRIVFIENREYLWKENALKVWQPRYPQILTDSDLIEISTNVTGFFSLLKE